MKYLKTRKKEKKTIFFKKRKNKGFTDKFCLDELDCFLLDALF